MYKVLLKQQSLGAMVLSIIAVFLQPQVEVRGDSGGATLGRARSSWLEDPQPWLKPWIRPA